MNGVPAGCPTSEQLRALVDCVLPDRDQSRVQNHVDNCATCQKALEALVAGSQSWNAAMDRWRHVPAPLSETVLADAMQRMKGAEFAEAAPAKSMAFNARDYLEPSDHPGSIGKLGVYQVTEVIGQGGMGVVLKAFDPSLHRVVAVKVLAPYLAHNPQARKRFVREAQAIAAVSHDHVITIHGIDESAEQPKIVMQFIAGRSLQQKIDVEGSLDLKEILRIGMQTASGLAAAHAQGLVHRDVKPSNILLENGIQRVKLTDFGLARAVDDASLTQSGVIAGTPQYMAPEQANGEAVDFRADLFSLGSVLYAMCVGHSPFRASTTMGVLKRVCHDPPRPIQEINPDIPAWLCAIIAKLLQKKPEDRFSTAREVAELLENWLAHVQQPIAIPTPAMAEKTPTAANHKWGSGHSTDREESEESNETSRRNAARAIDRRTIFFQTVSWRWFLFFLLLGIAITVASALNQNAHLDEVILVGVAVGLVFSAFGMLIVGLVRLVWANIFGRPAETSADRNLERRPNPMAPESMALLSAIIVMGVGGSFLGAVIVALIVWRVAHGRTLATAKTNQSAAFESAAGNSRFRFRPANSTQWATDINDWAHNLGKSIREFADNLTSVSSLERNRLFIAIGWCIAGSIEILVTSTAVGDSPMLLVSFLFCLLSFAESFSIYSRQNFGFVRIASYLNLLPITPGFFVRIPMSIITLIWQSAAATQDSFERTAWPETRLGRWIVGPIRLFGTLTWIALWSTAWVLFLAATITLIVIPFGPSRYEVREEAKVTLASNPEAQFRLAALGTGESEGLRPPTKVFRRQEVLLEVTKQGIDHQLRLQLGPVVRNESTHLELAEVDLEQFFSKEFGAPNSEPAANLFQAIHRLNETGGFGSQAREVTQPAWLSISDRIIMTRDVVRDLHHNSATPPPGYIELRSMLSPDLFHIRDGAAPNVYRCAIPSYLWELGLGTWCVLWLLGVRSITRRRHFRKTSSKSFATATA